MLQKFALTSAIGAALLSCAPGCTENAGVTPSANPTPPPLLSEPIGVQITRIEPRLAGMPFRVLLDFERPTDLAFLAPAPRAPQLASDRAHTGRAALRLAPGDSVAVKLAALLPGGFPARWTVAGAYFATTASTKITVAYRPNPSAAPLFSRTVEVRPGGDGWTPVFLDLTTPTAPGAAASAEAGQLTFDVAAADGPVYCDDVVILDNAKVLEAPAPGRADEASWSVRQAGFAIVAERPNRFRVTLKTPEATADGWTAQEACDLRARFVSTSGKTWAIYADGRQYQDGAFSPLVNFGPAVTAAMADQHANPADLAVPPALGRVDRDTPGDRYNDGYNETRGSYELIARGPRFEVTLTPHGKSLTRPVLEIAALPPGPILATVEGQLIEKSTRLPNGNLLLEIPLTIQRPTTVNVNVK